MHQWSRCCVLWRGNADRIFALPVNPGLHALGRANIGGQPLQHLGPAVQRCEVQRRLVRVAAARVLALRSPPWRGDASPWGCDSRCHGLYRAVTPCAAPDWPLQLRPGAARDGFSDDQSSSLQRHLASTARRHPHGKRELHSFGELAGIGVLQSPARRPHRANEWTSCALWVSV